MDDDDDDLEPVVAVGGIEERGTAHVRRARREANTCASGDQRTGEHLIVPGPEHMFDIWLRLAWVGHGHISESDGVSRWKIVHVNVMLPESRKGDTAYCPTVVYTCRGQ